MATENRDQEEKPQFSISSPQCVEELSPSHLSVQASSASMSGNTPIIGELTAQSNHPSEKISGKLLRLINASSDPTNSRSSSSYSPNTASGSPSFTNSAGSQTRLTNQVPYRAPILFPHQVWRPKQFPNPLPIHNIEGSSNPMLNMERVSHQSPAMNRVVLNAPRSRATGMLSSSSIFGLGQPASHGPNNLPIRAVENLSTRPVMASPFPRVAQSIARHNQSGPVMVSSSSGVPGSMLSHFQPGITGQSQAAVVNYWNSTHSHSLNTSGRGFRPTNQGIRPLNVPQQTTSSGPSLKRGASNSTPIPPAQRRRTRSTIPSRPSVATWRPIGPRQPQPSSDSIDLLLRCLLQDSLLQSSLESQSANYIKWHEEEKACPSGYECLICKRDLSYKAEGPMYEPDELQSTSVLACGHYFHSSCLLRFTPADQAGDPPCICCALDR